MGCRPGLFVALSPGMGKRVGDHPVMTALVYANHLAARTADFMLLDLSCIHPGNPRLVATHHMPVADLVVLPELFAAGSTMYRQHNAIMVQIFWWSRSSSAGSENLLTRTFLLRGNSRLNTVFSRFWS